MTTWDKCLKKIKKKLSTFEYNKWIKPKKVEHNINVLTVYCKNEN
ncbi:DnaA N-terminal domain-containing protein, partial [Francisella tularensis]